MEKRGGRKGEVGGIYLNNKKAEMKYIYAKKYT